MTRGGRVLHLPPLQELRAQHADACGLRGPRGAARRHETSPSTGDLHVRAHRQFASETEVGLLSRSPPCSLPGPHSRRATSPSRNVAPRDSASPGTVICLDLKAPSHKQFKAPEPGPCFQIEHPETRSTHACAAVEDLFDYEPDVAPHALNRFVLQTACLGHGHGPRVWKFTAEKLRKRPCSEERGRVVGRWVPGSRNDSFDHGNPVGQTSHCY